MFLKSLELHGFKSFPDRTKLEFGKGITAVVGPNGSGKSNISDAVRWVLGEQSTKTLRGAKMEDVIFGGTQLRKPQGFAEVSLTIDNSTGILAIDSDTVTITRKYYRSSESEYLINGSQVRLKDINELLMDTGLGRDGYSMVGQGKIAEIVGAKSAERREIFEEAAGISKFRYRKEESERRLKMAEENLLRLLDIVKELEDRIGPLKLQSEKAKQYLEFAAQKKELELSYWVHTLETLTVRLRSQDDKLTIANNESEEISRLMEKSEEKIQEIYRLMQGCMTLSEQLRNEKQEKERENADVSSKIAVIKNDISHNIENKVRLKEEICSLEQSDRVILEEIAQRNTACEQRREQITALEAKAVSLEAELTTASEQTAAFNEQSEALKKLLGELALRKTELSLTADVSRKRIAELKEGLEADRAASLVREENLSKTKAELIERQDDYKNCEARLLSLENSLKGYRMKQTSRREKLESVVSECSSFDLKIQEKNQKIRLLRDLEQNMEGFSGSVKAVLRAGESGRLRGIHGSVAQLISVDSRYSVAVEIALGGAMQNIVVEREEAAKAAIQLLKEQRAGRSTFLPLTSVRGNRLNEPSLSSEDGYVALASEIVEYNPVYEGVVQWLLGRVVVAEDIDAAVAIAKKYRYRFRIVTLDGQVVNAGGSISGGFVARSQGILSRKNDISRLEDDVKAMEQERILLVEKRNSLSAETAELDAQVQALQSEIQTASEDRIRLESECRRLEHLRTEYDEQLSVIEARVQTAQNQIETVTVTLSESEKQLCEFEKSTEEKAAVLSELEGSNAEILERFNDISSEISGLRIQKIELEKEIEALCEFVRALESRKSDAAQNALELSGRIDRLNQENEDLSTQITVLERETETRRLEITELDHRVVEALTQREQYEARTTKVREEQRHFSDRRENMIRETAHLEEQKLATQKEYDGIINQMWSEYEITRSQAETVAKPVEDFNALQRELNVVKGKIKGLGNVNLAAVDEYKEVKERYEYLTAQIEDVERSREELTHLIDDLTENMKELFSESFEKINRNFSQIFTDLFGGGKGELILTDPDDILETGIEINVQPPGKVIKNLAALSGGEQAFVAIAIYFAILKVRPAPFCILDEIEAALDDVNVSKYARYLRSYSDNTQFILITHRRGTMEEADVLYGVTMQQEGVSKLLELNVGEVEAKIGKLAQ